MPTPILFLSDAVSCTSGLGRITCDLATRLHEKCGDVFEVASAGYGSAGKRSVPFKEYHLNRVENWVVPELPEIWDDWTQGREGILMAVWDMSRLYWLGMPQTSPMPHLRTFAERKDVKKWAYHAIDAEGPNGGLSFRIAQTMKGFDRVIDYSKFSSQITGNPAYLPHGVNTAVFKPHPKAASRQAFAQGGFMGLMEDTFLIGIVATNQTRKNWALGMQVAKTLLDKGLNVRVWAHTDILDRYWSIGNLIVDYGLQGRVAVTTNRFSDEQMAWMYSSCDVTLGIGPEGFGYPIAESLACGVPCFAGSYGAQAEFVPEQFQIEPTDYYYEGSFCSKRPVHDPSRWVFKIMQFHQGNLTIKAALPESVDWNGPKLWPAWEKWFREGIGEADKQIQGFASGDVPQLSQSSHDRRDGAGTQRPQVGRVNAKASKKAGSRDGSI